MATVEQTQSDLVTLEIDGQSVEVARGSMIIEAADRIGVDIPRFCYHPKLSIAANCRMCLVDVEKAPKPLPACATPVADGMKVFTESRRAVDAQRGVMEFLLINHPLDCPICDQGGECELQDLAMGYGRSISRFTERKRVVKDKNLGPLVATDMTRCIHCTRCVRYLEEVAGTSELGGIGRGEKTEISTFVERNINSELSGNIIDLCPVGALTNKPFRFSARPWEMRARPSLGSHDCVGSNLFYHVRGQKIMRCVPRDNEAVNECWLADRDRYSHFGLNSEERLTRPRIKVDGHWHDADWGSALKAAAQALSGVELGALLSPRATTEEHFLLKALVNGLGSEHIDHRLRLNDFRHPAAGRAHMDIASREWPDCDAVLLVGSNIRHDQPILGHRLRTAWRKRQARIMDINPVAYPFHFDLVERSIVPPQRMVDRLAAVTRAALAHKGRQPGDDVLGKRLATIEVDESARAMVEQLASAERALIVLGDGALTHADAAWLRELASLLAETLDVALCVLPGPANSEGAWRAGAVPGPKGLDAAAMVQQRLPAYLLWDIDPALDLARPASAREAFTQARVVAVSSFADAQLEAVADVLLPLAPVPETDGSYVNLDGRHQAFAAALKAPGEARAGWKILRRLGELLGLDGFDFVSLDAVQQRLEAVSAPATGQLVLDESETGSTDELWRIGDVPIYAGDNLLRRAPELQKTHHADDERVRVNPATASRLGLVDKQAVRVRVGSAEVSLDWLADDRIATDAVWLPAASRAAAALDGTSGPIVLELAK
ncbi:MAG: NADH-quinone oxidoreductase subunit NuoG [Wenzhouxiangella sp.]